ncbi:MAG: T9SS type A sorting domain-containing protein, partial [Flavobacteriales bacterium]
WVHKLNVPVQDLESGVYFLKIETSENQTLKRLIIE